MSPLIKPALQRLAAVRKHENYEWKYPESFMHRRAALTGKWRLVWDACDDGSVYIEGVWS
jgi:hypothetical protein